MRLSRFVPYGLLLALPGQSLLAAAAVTAASDPCVKVAGLQFADPADAIACQKSFPLNETLRQNDFYLNLPPPFQESTTDIRADISRINATNYATDYEFNLDLWGFTTQLNDGHTQHSACTRCHLDNGIFIAPDSVELLNQLGSEFTDNFAAKNFNWQRLAGARVLTIGGLPASDYIDEIARTVSGNVLDHNVRVNSVVSSYRIVNTTFSQRVGDLAGPLFLTDKPQFRLIPVNSTVPKSVDVPFVAAFVAPHGSRSSRSTLADARPTDGSTGVIRSFVLPGNKTGVMFVGSFEGDYYQFPLDVQAAVTQFKTSGVTNLLVDVANNPGGYVYLGYFLYQYLAGTEAGGFQSTSRANPFAQKILEAVIDRGLNHLLSYAPDNCKVLCTISVKCDIYGRMPLNFDYNVPSAPFVINGRSDPTSQRFEDAIHPVNVTIPCIPPFDVIGNGNCASTCAVLTTAMFERHQTKMAVFGRNHSQPIQYKGSSPSTMRKEWMLMFAFAGKAGSQVLEWGT
ncbi:hypothetical protein V8E53_002783 [Lactarius tabidus]